MYTSWLCASVVVVDDDVSDSVVCSDTDDVRLAEAEEAAPVPAIAVVVVVVIVVVLVVEVVVVVVVELNMGNADALGAFAP